MPFRAMWVQPHLFNVISLSMPLIAMSVQPHRKIFNEIFSSIVSFTHLGLVTHLTSYAIIYSSTHNKILLIEYTKTNFIFIITLILVNYKFYFVPFVYIFLWFNVLFHPIIIKNFNLVLFQNQVNVSPQSKPLNCVMKELELTIIWSYFLR